MNILLITNNLYPTGGDWTYVDSISKLYKQHGHNVYLWGQYNDKNIYHDHEEFFVGYLDREGSRNKLLSAISIVKRAIHSKEAADKITEYLEKIHIDIVQLNSINIGLTPSIIEAIHKKNIPIVWRILDYKMICPTTNMLRDNRVCELCRNGNYINCIKTKCKNKSLRDSIVVALETWYNRRKDNYGIVDTYLFQNLFTKLKYTEWGFPIKDAFVVNNPYDVSKIQPNYNSDGFVLYFGRTDPSKGVMTILKAAKQDRNIRYVIVGKGSQDIKIQSYIRENNLLNVEFLGPKWGEEMDDIIDKASIVIVPSEWYEPSPYVVLQAFAHGKPVVGSRMGGIPEMITEMETGLLFEAGNETNLLEKIQVVLDNTELRSILGRNARKEVELNYSPENYYNKTIELFNRLINR